MASVGSHYAAVYFFRQSHQRLNRLPSYVVEAPSVNSLKNRLDDFLQDMGN